MDFTYNLDLNHLYPIFYYNLLFHLKSKIFKIFLYNYNLIKYNPFIYHNIIIFILINLF